MGRFASADTVVPNPNNPQSFNRYSYVNNSPINFNDPTGHLCNDPGDEVFPLFCNQQPGNDGGTDDIDDLPSSYCQSIPEECSNGGDDGLLGDILNTIYDSTRYDPIIEPVGVIGAVPVFLTIMPVDYPTICIKGSGLLCAYEPGFGLVMGIAGFTADVGELLQLIGGQVPSSTLTSLADVIITLGGCGGNGECYIAQPHPNLPLMIVAGQDVLVTAVDMGLPVVVGSAVGGGTGNPVSGGGALVIADFASTAFSLWYDSGRLNGQLRNRVSLGYSGYALWVLVYP